MARAVKEHNMRVSKGNLANFVLNVGLVLDALTEFEHVIEVTRQKSYIARGSSSNFSEISCVSINVSKPREIL
jgi:hypothetical protein